MLKSIEKLMDEYLVKKAPFQIPKEGKKNLVEWFPWIALVVGALQLIGAWQLWRAGRYYDEAIGYLNEFSRVYGGVDTPSYSVGPMFYLAVAAFTVSAVLMFVAFPGLKDKSKKKGWDILLISVIFSLAYGVFAAFTSSRFGGGFGDLLGSLIGALIGLYLLAQVKDLYNGAKAKKSEAKK